jgi:DNA-binding IclR family transcriptional regulator
MTYATQETALLTVRDGMESLCVQRVASPQPLRLILEPGYRASLHAGALQKTLLAFAPEDIRIAVMARRLARYTDSTIVRRRDLKAEIALIRGRGYAVSIAEVNSATWGVAAPVLDGEGLAVAAVGCAGPLTRYTEEKVQIHVAACRSAADAIALTIAP